MPLGMAMQYAVPFFYVALGLTFIAQIATYLASDRSRLRKIALACGLVAVIVGAIGTKLTSNHLENLVHLLANATPAAAGKL
jgi:bifunctional ADP-heptose synthase (sugar kinase/adenylyltransferase)